MWTALGIVAAAALVVFWRGPSAVWGGAILGAAAGLATSIVTKGSMAPSLGKGAIVGILLGVAAELLGRLSRRLNTTRES
jgi:hypothetical protein